ncbi:DUF599 domain-containing protein [Gammaproteobacteria bacterium]
MALSELSLFFQVHAQDLTGIALSLTLWSFYQAYSHRCLRQDPAATIQGINTIARTAWVEMIMREGRDILAVQTLRNSTMAATFLASTAILLMMGVLNVASQGAKLGETWHIDMGGTLNHSLWAVKLLMLLMDLFVAFFAFAMSIRLFNHVGYLINVHIGSQRQIITVSRVANHLNQAGFYYHVGMRAYYALVPLLLWLFGPYLMVLGTLGMVLALYRMDHVPETVRQDYRITDNRL